MSGAQKEWPELVLAESLPKDVKLEKIPQPPEHFFGLLGNLPDMDATFLHRSLWRLADLYGPIYYLNAVNRKFVVVSNYEYGHQMQDDNTSEKTISGALKILRDLLGDGLFSAFPEEKNWHKAHRLLVPVFGPLAVKKMFPSMLDIASQMILKWDRLGPDNAVSCSDDFTRLAFDTIGLCSFSFRFNQFYKDSVHPFATQMADVLFDAGKMANRISLENSLRRWSAAERRSNIQKMYDLTDEIINDRKKNPRPDLHDLLNVMLEAKDPVTGEGLGDENIRANLITFLVAGHETTSGTLSFLFYNLLKNPETLHRAQQEVDRVLGDSPIEVKHIPELKYVYAAIQETLRLNGPIGGVIRHPKKDVVLSNKYRINADTGVLISFKGMHTDPKIWGEDAKEFKPERFFNKDIPQDAWKPFGVGMRSCIGRYFAEQEMVLNVALILQRFQVEMADPQYEFRMKVTLTMKPDEFHIKLRRRPGKDSMVGLNAPAQTTHANGHQSDGKNGTGLSKLTVAYGSNAGTCKTFAEDLQSTAPEHGFKAEVVSLDHITENIPTDTPFVVVTSSYEGKAPDNAKKFVSWLEAGSQKPDALKKSQFAVFGIGNTEWVATYQAIPKTVRNHLREQGASEICEPCFSDIKADSTGDWEKWTEKFWAALKNKGQGGESEQKAELKASVLKHDAPAVLAGEDVSWGVVKSVRSLGGQGVGPEKREVAVQLPEGVHYRTGDYLSILPFNHPIMVQRVLSRFKLHVDDLINITGTRKAFLKSDQPPTAQALFAQRVELNSPVTQKQLEALAKFANDDKDRDSLLSLAGADKFPEAVTAKNYTVLDALEDHPSVDLPLSRYLDILKPLSPRQYSISSSMLDQQILGSHKANQEGSGEAGPIATVTYDVHMAPARSGSSRTFYGAASSYLARLIPGARIHCSVRATNAAFHLPEDPKVPVIFIAAGTGIAPMRGFVQERAAIAAARGKDALGPALLYFGCRDFERDNLYANEMAEWQHEGAVEMRPAFSKRGPPGQESFKYVHERMLAEKEDLSTLFRQGAKIFLCGSAGKLAKSAAEALKKIYRERFPEKSEDEAEAWLSSIKETRYVTDVFE